MKVLGGRGETVVPRVQPLTPSCPSVLLQGEEGASEDSGQEAQQQHLRGQDKGETQEGGVSVMGLGAIE